MILDFDKNNLPIVFDGNGTWYDGHGFAIDPQVGSHFEQRGQVTGIAIGSTGLKSSPVVLPVAYANELDEVFIELFDPSATDAVVGAAFITGDSVTGFTLNVNVITASATSGATIKAKWKALGQ